MFDTNAEFDLRVRRRLAEEWIIWLTTIDSKGRPQPRPVWFLWNGDNFLIFSSANTYKLKHIAANSQVSLHLDGDGKGGDIVIFSGEAVIDQKSIPEDEMAAYNDKYQAGFKRIGMTAEQFADAYQAVIRVTPTKLRGH